LHALYLNSQLSIVFDRDTAYVDSRTVTSAFDSLPFAEETEESEQTNKSHTNGSNDLSNKSVDRLRKFEVWL